MDIFPWGNELHSRLSWISKWRRATLPLLFDRTWPGPEWLLYSAGNLHLLQIIDYPLATEVAICSQLWGRKFKFKSGHMFTKLWGFFSLRRIIHDELSVKLWNLEILSVIKALKAFLLISSCIETVWSDFGVFPFFSCSEDKNQHVSQLLGSKYNSGGGAPMAPVHQISVRPFINLLLTIIL